MDHKQEVVKHSSAIQIENVVTLLQRRAWNVLLANAYDDLPTEEVYSITVKELASALGYASRNETHLRETLKNLMATIIEWNVVGKDHEHIWGAATLLAEVEIENGVCTYAFGPRLRQRLHNPKMYARISLSIQNQFSSKHALALYELSVDYLHTDRMYGETPFISMPDFRKLMGLSDDVYPEFKKLNKWVIKDPVNEINTVTDLHVTPSYKRQGRRVVAVKFTIERRLEIPSTCSQQPLLFPDLDDMPPGVIILCEAGLASADARAIWQQGVNYIEAADKPEPEAFDAYLREKIDLLRRRMAQGKVESVTGFLLAAIKQNYPNPEYTKATEKRRQAHRTRTEAERQEALSERFEAHREQVFWQRFDERPAAWQDEQRERFEAMIQSDPLHRFVWQSYREHKSLQTPIVAGVFMETLASELLTQPEEMSLESFASWAEV